MYEKVDSKSMTRRNKIVLVVFVSLFVGFIYLLCKPAIFVTTNYTLTSPKITSSVRIAHLSDIHNQEYGKDNKDLIEAVASQNPDFIFITGDSVSMHDEDVSSAIALVEELTEIAPVYYVYGNHEVINDNEYKRNMGDLFAKAGAHVLDFDYEDIDIKGQRIRIGGLYGFCLPKKYLETGDARKEEVDFLEEFQNTQRYTMLLTHLPAGWLEHDGLEEWEIDSVFSGHSHGGQIVLPVLGPVVAPDQGWFPDKVAGLFSSEDGRTQLIVSRGLGDSVKVPRINNDPELIIVDVIEEKIKNLILSK